MSELDLDQVGDLVGHIKLEAVTKVILTFQL
jgi:hypothetical protein